MGPCHPARHTSQHHASTPPQRHQRHLSTAPECVHPSPADPEPQCPRESRPDLQSSSPTPLTLRLALPDHQWKSLELHTPAGQLSDQTPSVFAGDSKRRTTPPKRTTQTLQGYVGSSTSKVEHPPRMACLSRGPFVRHVTPGDFLHSLKSLRPSSWVCGRPLQKDFLGTRGFGPSVRILPIFRGAFRNSDGLARGTNTKQLRTSLLSHCPTQPAMTDTSSS